MVIFFIFLILIMILYIKKLKSRIKNQETLIQYANDRLIQSEQRKADYKDRDADIQNDVLKNPKQYYYLKRSCMNKNESRMFYYINCALDEFFPDSNLRNNYIVFPQVSLHAFFGIDADLKSTPFSYNIARRNLVAKNVDFIVCNRYYKDNYYFYNPIVLIELDGSSHYSSSFGKEELTRQQESDHFKDRLTHAFNIPLIRYRIDSNDHVVKSDRDKIKEKLRNCLFSTETKPEPMEMINRNLQEILTESMIAAISAGRSELEAMIEDDLYVTFDDDDESAG